MALTERYSSDEFAVLAFPCNQFGGQEPGTPDEILAFAGKYGATFPMFEKVDVNGPNTCVKWHSNSRALRSPSLSRLEERFLHVVEGRSFESHPCRHPLFKHLKSKKGEEGLGSLLGNDIKWNFVREQL